ncbi:putative RelA/SpoT domain-containing protein [Seiridium cardinale]
MSTTSLHWAAMLNDAQFVQDLVEAEARVDVIDDVGLTTLAHAVEARPSGKCVDLLVSAGAAIAAFDHNRDPNILHRACRRGVVDTVKKLRRAGVNLDIPARVTLITPLMASMTGGQAETIEYLIISGADINAVDQMGRSSQRYATEHKRYQEMMLLMRRGANYRQVDKDSQTLLHDAAVRDDPKTGNTALDIQWKHGSTDSAIRAAFQSLLDGIQDTTQVKMDNIDEDVFFDALE